MILIAGSLAYDNIMDFPGRFAEHILPEKIHILNVSFLVETLKRQRGGIAGNIAHSLALLGERPAILAAAGEDFDSYREFLKSEGVNTDYIQIVPGEFTATAFITTDLSDNQITGFYPGAMKNADELSLTQFAEGKLDIVLIGADKPEAMMRYCRECQELNIPYIFDPSQQIVRLSDEDLQVGISGAKVIIGNDYEIQLISNRLNMTEDDLKHCAEYLIITLGEKGSVIHTGGERYEIPIAKPHNIIDPTGAGDAYRAGIIKGLTHGWEPDVMGRVASQAAVYAIETYGAQEHQYSQSEFEARFNESFGSEIQL